MFNFKKNKEDEDKKEQEKHAAFITSCLQKMSLQMKEIDDYSDTKYPINGVIESKTRGDSYIIVIPRGFAKKLIARAKIEGDDSIKTSIIPALYKSYSEKMVMGELGESTKGCGNCPSCKAADALEENMKKNKGELDLDSLFSGDFDLPEDTFEYLTPLGKAEIKKIEGMLFSFFSEYKKQLSDIDESLPDKIDGFLSDKGATDFKKIFKFTSLLNEAIEKNIPNVPLSLTFGYSRLLSDIKTSSEIILDELNKKKASLIKERDELMEKMRDDFSSILSKEAGEVSDSLISLADKVGKKKIEKLAKGMNLSIDWKKKKITKIDSK